MKRKVKRMLTRIWNAETYSRIPNLGDTHFHIPNPGNGKPKTENGIPKTENGILNPGNGKPNLGKSSNKRETENGIQIPGNGTNGRYNSFDCVDSSGTIHA